MTSFANSNTSVRNRRTGYVYGFVEKYSLDDTVGRIRIENILRTEQSNFVLHFYTFQKAVEIVSSQMMIDIRITPSSVD